jgi:hypothetical protein
VADLETSPGALIVTASAVNQSLLPSSGLAIAGAGGARSLTITSAPGRTGTTRVTLTVSDGVATATESFLVTVSGPAAKISGLVSGPAGPLAGIDVVLTGGATRATVTGPDGRYSFEPLLPGVAYTVAAEDDAYAFSPSAHTIASLAGAETADFGAVRVLTLSGHVEDLSGAGVPEVAMTLAGDLSLTTQTDAEGRYAFRVQEGGVYTVTPSRPGFVFTTPVVSLAALAEDTTADFLAVAGRYERYFAEGATGDFFDTSLALLNPTPVPASVTLRFERADGAIVSLDLTVPAETRATVDPEGLAGLEAAQFSTVVTSNVPVAAERTMRWDASGYGSHAEVSIAQPQTTWYLAEGATLGGFDLFYLLHNPGGEPAAVTVRYLLPAPQPSIVKQHVLAPHSRLTIWVDQEDPALAAAEVSAVIESTNGVAINVERAMYLSEPGVLFAAGHEGAGVPSPATHWFFAEGATGRFFDCFILLANPSGQTALVEARYLLPDGAVVTKRYSVDAGSRFNIWVDLEDARLADTAVSTTLTSLNGVAIVAERAMWWVGPSGRWQEGHNSAGATASGTKWAVAGGESGGPSQAETFVLVANTSPVAGQIRVSVMLEDGTRLDQTHALPATSRLTVPVGGWFPAASGRRYGVVVESLGPDPAEIVVERAMYSDALGADGSRTPWAAGTSALGTRIR